MTPESFRAALAALGMTQAAFARFLAAHDHPSKGVARSVRRWAQVGPPGEVVVILRLLDRIPPDFRMGRALPSGEPIAVAFKPDMLPKPDAAP